MVAFCRAVSAQRNSAKAEQLLEQIDREVKIHSQIEEEIFYPAFRDAARKRNERELYYEAKEEHHVVDLVMTRKRRRCSRRRASCSPARSYASWGLVSPPIFSPGRAALS